MAITNISTIQSNVTGVGYPVAIHNPLVYIIEVDYTTTAPDKLYANNQIDTKIYSCIPYSDPLPGKRRFIFIADEIIRGMMLSFDDIIQGDSTLVHRDNKTLFIEWRFYDPDNTDMESFPSAEFIHASRQFGESPCLDSIHDNDTEDYIGVVGFPCYAYCYNNSSSNTITVAEL